MGSLYIHKTEFNNNADQIQRVDQRNIVFYLGLYGKNEIADDDRSSLMKNLLF